MRRELNGSAPLPMFGGESISHVGFLGTLIFAVPNIAANGPGSLGLGGRGQSPWTLGPGASIPKW